MLVKHNNQSCFVVKFLFVFVLASTQGKVKRIRKNANKQETREGEKEMVFFIQQFNYFTASYLNKTGNKGTHPNINAESNKNHKQ